MFKPSEIDSKLKFRMWPPGGQYTPVSEDLLSSKDTRLWTMEKNFIETSFFAEVQPKGSRSLSQHREVKPQSSPGHVLTCLCC